MYVEQMLLPFHYQEDFVSQCLQMGGLFLLLLLRYVPKLQGSERQQALHPVFATSFYRPGWQVLQSQMVTKASVMINFQRTKQLECLDWFSSKQYEQIPCNQNRSNFVPLVQMSSQVEDVQGWALRVPINCCSQVLTSLHDELCYHHHQVQHARGQGCSWIRSWSS